MSVDARRVDLPVELAQQILRLCKPAEWTAFMFLSKSWRRIVETERYETLHIVFDPSASTKTGAHPQLQLFRTLEQSPHLARRVKSLAFDMRITQRAWLQRCNQHHYSVSGPCIGARRQLPRQILSNVAFRDRLIRRSLSSIGLISQWPRTGYIYSDSTLREIIAHGVLRCGLSATENTVVFLAAVVLALRQCCNLHTLDLRDELPVYTLYGQALLVAINTLTKLRHLAISQSLVATELFALRKATARDDLPCALVQAFSHNELEEIGTVEFGNESSQVANTRKVLVICGTLDCTPVDLIRLHWLSTEGVSVITRQDTYSLHFYVSHYGETPSAFARYAADIAEHFESLSRNRSTSWKGSLGWDDYPEQIQVSLFAHQLDPHLGSIIDAVASLQRSIKYLKLIFCMPEVSEEARGLPQVSAERLVQIMAPLHYLEKVTLWNGMHSKAEYAIRAPRREFLAAARHAGMRNLKEVAFLGQPWQFGCRYLV